MAEISELNGYKIKDKKAIRFYNTVADMIADTTLKENMYVKTSGYYSANDGGSAEYTIKSSSNKYCEELANNLVAELNAEVIYSKQLGISEINSDNTEKLQIFINNSQYFKKAYLQGGTYDVRNPLTMPTSAKIYVESPVIINDYSTSSTFITFVASEISDELLKNEYHKSIITGNDCLYIINKTNTLKTCFNIGSTDYTFNGFLTNINIRNYNIGIILNPINLYWVTLKDITMFNGDIGIKLNSGTKSNSDELVNIERCCFTRLNCCIDIENQFIFNIKDTAFDFNECVFYCNNYAEINCTNCHFEGTGNRSGEIGSGYNNFYGIIKAKDSNLDYNRTNISINDSRIVGNTLIGFNKKMFKGTSLYVILNNTIFQYGNTYKDLLIGDNSFEDAFLTDSDVRKVTIKNCRSLYNDIYPNFYDRKYNLVDPFLETDSTTEEKTITSANVSNLLETLTNYDLYGLGDSTASGTKYQITTLNGNKKQIIIKPPYTGASSCLGLITKKYFDVSKLDELVFLAFSKSTLDNCMIRCDIIYYDHEKNEISIQNAVNNASNTNKTNWFASPYPVTRPYTNNYTPLIPPTNAEYFKVRFFLRATNNADSTDPAYFTGFYLF